MSQKAEYHELAYEKLDEAEALKRSRQFMQLMLQRRTVRDFSQKPVPIELIENAITVAKNAPSGANQQPWTFAVVQDVALKQQIREAAEEEERTFYAGRASEEWLEALSHLGTDADKPHLTDAPYLIVCFRQSFGYSAENEHGEKQKIKHYYSDESMGIAVGMLLTALHVSGLVTLTHTPSPMKFLANLLGRPDNERAYVIIPVGYPKEGAKVPSITKKPLEEVMIIF